MSRHHEQVAPETLQEVAAEGWPATDEQWLGRWWLRAAEGFTGRANSVVPLGDPRVPVAEAARRVEEWYADRGLPAYAMVVVGSDVDAALRRLRWRQTAPRWSHLDVMVQTAPVGAVVARLEEAHRTPPAVTVEIWPEPYDGWLALYRDGEVPPVARRVLGHPKARFAALLRDGAVVAIARSVVTSGWVGISAVEVHPDARREGLARAVVLAVLTDAARRGATDAYLQVSDDNAAAVGLYGALGFTTHHRYCYLTPAAP